MGERPRDNDNDLYERAGRRRLPRWVTIAIIVLAVAGLLVVIAMLVGGLGPHNPARHFGSAATGLLTAAGGRS